MASLQDQLLKAGLVDAKSVKKAKKEKSKQAKVARNQKEVQVDETKLVAQQARQQKAERDRELNRQKQQQAQQKAIAAQIKQLIEMNRINKGDGDIGFNFTDDKKIKKIYLTEVLQQQLSSGRLAIAKWIQAGETAYEVLPAAVADKIAERDAAAIVFRADKSATESDEDDPYAEYQIPDDLMW